MALRVLVACVVLGVGALGQDTRVVTEPNVPPVCTKLEAELGTLTGALRPEDEGKLDTMRIQKAIDGCKPGEAVELSAGKRKDYKLEEMVIGPMNYVPGSFLTGPLELRDGVTLLIDKGVTLYASRDPKVYESDPESARCGTSMPRPKDLPTFSMSGARPKGGCRPLITVNAKNAAIMGDGVIDGRGYATLLGKDYSWWQLARKAQPNDDLYWSVKLIVASHADNFILYKIRLHNSPNYHVTVSQTNGFTAWGVHLLTPTDKKYEGRNTDGIDPGTSQNITIAHSWIDNGDDNIAIKQGVSHMSVLDNHFYTGHGMSIGSETVLGQSFLLVDGLTEDHTTSGIRIKSNVKRGGPVHDLTYRNVCMTGVQNPIAISPYYTNQTVEPFEDPKYAGDKIPDYKRISLQSVFSETPGDVLIAGLDDAHRTEISLENVNVKGITPGQIHLAYADVRAPACGGRKDQPMTNVLPGKLPPTVKMVPPAEAGCGARPLQVPDPCVGKFVPMQ